MTEQDHSRPSSECGADVAAYALGALHPAEVAAFEKHLDGCSVCREELISFQQVVDAMPLTAESRQASPALRRSVMRTVREEAALAQRRAKPTGFAAWPGLVSKPAFGLAVVVAAVIAVGGVVLGTQGSGTRVYTAQVVGSGTAAVRVNGTQAELVVHHFAAPARGHVYEVWLKRAGKPPVPTNALFGVTSSGDSTVSLPSGLRHGDLIMVTAEPDGGTKVPTTSPVISVQLT